MANERELPDQKEGQWTTWDLPGDRKTLHVPPLSLMACKKATLLAQAGRHSVPSLSPLSKREEPKPRLLPQRAFRLCLLCCHNRLGYDRSVRKTRDVLHFLLDLQSFYQTEVWDSFATGIFIML